MSTPRSEPGLARKGVNFGRAVARHVADGRRKASSEIYEQRLAVCSACPSCDLERMVCRESACGCRLRIKASWNSERCPLGKWPDETETSQQSEPAEHEKSEN